MVTVVDLIHRTLTPLFDLLCWPFLGLPPIWAMAFVSLISGRLIDFIRVHISQIGGLTPAKKLAAFCEFFNVRTAWHGPGDVSPVGHAANVHLDLTVPNFGVQEPS